MSTVRRLLVIAAHPDDDAIGCGGTMSLVARAGGDVRVIYVTDGSASHPGSKQYAPAAIRDLRENEASSALQQLGIETPPIFLRCPDSGLRTLRSAAREALEACIEDAITATRPDLIFAPWRRDPHADHVVTGEAALAAALVCGRSHDLAAYGVWLSIRGEDRDQPRADEVREECVTLDEAARAAKRRAILAHRSQTSDLIYDDPNGFRIDAALLERWLTPFERFYRYGRLDRKSVPFVGRTAVR